MTRGVWLRQFAGVGAANVASSALTFGAFFVLGLRLGNDAFRQLSVGYAICTLVIAVADSRVTVVRAMGISETRIQARSARVWRYAVVAVALCIGAGIRARLGLSLSVTLVAVAAAAGMSEFNAQMAHLIGGQRFRVWGRAYVLTNFAKSAAMILVGALGPAAALGAYGAVSALAAVCLFLAFRTGARAVPGSSTDPAPPRLLPLVTATLVTAMATRIDLFLVNSLVHDSEALADYSRLILVINGQLLLQASVTALLLPRAMSLANNAAALLRAGLGGAALMSAVSLASVVALTVLPVYSRALPMYVLMVPALIAQGFTVTRSIRLYTYRGGRLLAPINLVELIVSAAVVLLLAPRFGVTAAAIARASSMLAGSVLTEVGLRRAAMAAETTELQD